MSTVWTNWAGQQRCAPVRIERPESEEALVGAIARAVADGLPIRAVGSGHSFTDTALTDGVMIDQAAMDQILDVDPSSGLVRVQAGIKLRALTPQLAEHGLALENQGDIDVQSLAGALATATHGTGARFANLPANVVGCRLVTADGAVHDLTEDDDTLKAARVSVGALGVISEYTLRCVPAFRIRRIDTPRALDEILERLDADVDGHDHYEVFAFPYSGRALALASERTDAAPQPRTKWQRRQEDLVTNEVLDVLLRIGRRFPSQTPRLSRLMTSFLTHEEHLDQSHRIYANERRVRFTEMEYAIPRAHARAAVERVDELIARRRVPLSFPIELRFAAGDEASLLSTAYGRETAYIAVHQYVGMEYESYFRGVEAIMDEYDGRPHWGKRHYQTAVTLGPRYPAWERFQAVRARLDPDGVFANDYVRRVLG